MKSRQSRVILFLFLLIVYPMFGQYILAFATSEATSTSFQIKNFVIDLWGGLSTSTSYQNFGSGAQIAPGESSSTNFILESGSLYISEFTPKSQNWRWYGDETNETPTGALATENTAPSNIENRDLIKLRIAITEQGGVTGADVKYKVQFSQSSAFSSGVTDVVESGSCVDRSEWCYANGVDTDNDVISTSVLTDSESCVSSSGNGCGRHNESGISTTTFDHTAGTTKEFEFTIQNRDATHNATYFFRMYDTTNGRAVPLNTGESYPSLVASPATLTVTITGVNSGVSTEGIVTDITSTPTSIPFGQLTATSPAEAAQTVTVSTSATGGYKLYLYKRSDLGSSSGDTISDVSGTNESPSSWAIVDGSNAAYGYHSGDSVLSSGTTDRFSADDTYSKLESVVKEIVYTSTPISSESTNIVFKVEMNSKQEAGNYAGSFGYLIVPEF